jgi:carbamoyl-phosphate synthase large subunit
MSKRILISGLGGSLFPYLHTKLIAAGFDPHYVDSNSVLKYIYPDLNFYPAPLVSDKNYKKFISDLCKEKSIDVYMPLIDEELLTAVAIPEEISSLKVLAPKAEFIQLCLDKFSLMKKLRESGISDVPTWRGEEFKAQLPFPVFVKPNYGRGSRGIRKIDNKQQLDAYYTLEKFKPSEVIVQPFIDGTEYTVSVLVNSKNKVLSISAKRIIQKRGITISAVTENNKVIEGLAEKITNTLQPKGPFNIQLFLASDSTPFIFEINPRFSTTLVLSYEAGLDEVSMLVDNFENENVLFRHALNGVHLFRHWSNSFYKI